MISIVFVVFVFGLVWARYFTSDSLEELMRTQRGEWTNSAWAGFAVAIGFIILVIGIAMKLWS